MVAHKDTPPERLNRPGGQAIAYHALPGKSPGVVFCSGFRSDMTGTKAAALAAACAAAGRSYVRFDYFGHGQSTGEFADGTIGRWTADALAAIDELTAGPLVLVGSSMGGWIALLAALARPDRVKGLVLVAPAPDFTEGFWNGLTPAAQAYLRKTGRVDLPSQYSGEPTPMTLKLIEDGRDHLLLHKPVPFAGPVRILQGMQDPDVPWAHAVKVMEQLQGADVRLTLFKTGDHRLSKLDEIGALERAVDEVCTLVGGSATPDGMDDGG